MTALSQVTAQPRMPLSPRGGFSRACGRHAGIARKEVACRY
jgi:hypothetical protein